MLIIGYIVCSVFTVARERAVSGRSRSHEYRPTVPVLQQLTALFCLIGNLHGLNTDCTMFLRVENELNATMCVGARTFRSEMRSQSHGPRLAALCVAETWAI
jgi:hypothetical protein